MSESSEQLPNSERVYQVSRADLPVHCPTDAMPLWSSHPRVFLPVEQQGEARCPYCGALFRLAAD